MTRDDTRSRIIAFIKDYRRKWHCGPSIREIQRAMGWRSNNSARSWLAKLYNEGRVTWEPHKAGTIRTLP